VPDISCEHCERAITQALQTQPGVEQVQVNIPDKQVTLRYTGSLLDLDKVKAVLTDEGYPVSGVQPA
jgi:copper chaperone